MAWVALTPLLAALCGGTLGRAFMLGLLTGAIFFTGTLYWITRVLVLYGNLPQGIAVPINAALIAYLALFPGLFALVVRRLTMAHGPAALMAAPLVWVATELGRTYVFTGFPWGLLGYSQATFLPIAQLASLFGVYGVSMLVAAVSSALALLATRRWHPASAGFSPNGTGTYPAQAGRHGRMGPVLPLVVVLAVVIVVAAWGSRRASHRAWTHAGDPIRVGVIQGNVDQAQKWDATRAASILNDYLRMTRQAVGEGARFVLWPESSTPFMFDEEREGADRIRTLAALSRVPILFGSDQIVRRTADTPRVPARYFNSAFLVRADGATGGVYHKMHLVPFGEYVPLEPLLFFAAPLTGQVGTFAPGGSPALLPVGGHPISVAICYEVVYPALVREFVRGGSELLTTITNDAWFGDTSAPYQHFEQASMRAIEEGRYLVRSANTGISGIVDPYGGVTAKTSIFEPAVLVGEARFLRTSTFYARHGDLLADASVLMTAVLLVASRRRVQ